MPSLGDMTLILNADERRLQEGLARAEAAAKRAAGNIKGAMGGGGAGAAVGQASFAVQDFASVMMQGGERNLSRAIGGVTNNLQMMGAAFGPWGVAVATGIALVTQLGVSMYETSQKVDGGSEALKAYGTATDELAAKVTKSVQFEQSLRRLQTEGTAKQVADARRETKEKIEQLDEEIRERNKRLTAIAADRKASGRPLEIEEKVELMGMTDKIKELEDQRQRQFKRDIALEAIEADAKQNDAKKKAAKDLADYQKEQENRRIQEATQNFQKEMRQFEERVSKIRDVYLATRTPMEVFEEKSKDIQAMLQSGDLDADTAARALRRERDQLPQQRSTQAALIEGSAEAVSAILGDEERRAAERETLRLQEEMLAEMRETKKAMEDLAKAFDQTPVSIN